MLWLLFKLKESASSVDNPDIMLETAVSISFHLLPLAVEIGRGNAQPRNFNARPPAFGLGHVNHVDVEDAQDEPTIVMGTLLVNSVPASVLFDSGASHSFISEKFAFMHGITYEEMRSPLVVSTPGSQCRATMMTHNTPIKIEGLEFLASLIVLKSSNIDVILGMDWLKPIAP